VKCLKTALIFFLVYGCTQNKSSTSFSLELVEEIPLQESPNHFLGRVHDIACVTDGIYVASVTTHSVLHFSWQGVLLNVIGAKGSGPGELQRPVSISILNDTLAVLEDGSKRISFFKRNGSFIKSKSVDMPFLNGMKLSQEQGYFIACDGLGIYDYQIYTSQGVPLSKKRKKHPTGLSMPIQSVGGQVSLTTNNEILFSPMRTYQILRLNWQGDTLKTYRANPESYIQVDLSSQARYSRQDEYSLIGLPLELNGYILSQRNKMIVNKKDIKKSGYERVLDIFDQNGKLLAYDIKKKYDYFGTYQENLIALSIEGNEETNLQYSIKLYKLVVQ